MLFAVTLTRIRIIDSWFMSELMTVRLMLGTNFSYWHVKLYNWICEGPTCVLEAPNLIKVKAIN